MPIQGISPGNPEFRLHATSRNKDTLCSNILDAGCIFLRTTFTARFPREYHEKKGEGSVEPIDVGKRIKSIRKKKNLTLQEVSEKSGMSATAISAIERNVSSPTVTTLTAIGRALGESLSSLLGESEIDYVVTRAGNRERLATDIRNVEFQSLAAGVPGQRFHPKLSILKPGANSGEDLVNHHDDDFFFVIRGALSLEIDGTFVKLEEGDSIYFRGNTPYRWKNDSGGEDTHLLLVTAS